MRRKLFAAAVAAALCRCALASAQSPEPLLRPAEVTPAPRSSVAASALPASPAPAVVVPTTSAPSVLDPGAPNCSKHCGFYVGAGFYYLKPTWNDAVAYDTRTVLAGTGGSSVNVSQTFIDHDYAAAPKVWLGYTGQDGFGIRGSWFTLGSAGNTLNASIPRTVPGSLSSARVVAPGYNRANDDVLGGGFSAMNVGVIVVDSSPNASSTLQTTSNLNLSVFDLELTQALNLGNWNLLFSGGARYARIDQSYGAFAKTVSAVGGTGFNQVLDLTNDFSGIGPELALEVTRRLGQGGFSIYGYGRAGLLFGTSQVNQIQSLATTSGAPLFQTGTRERSDSVSVPFLEIEGGVQYARNFGALAPFLRVGVVGQRYYDVGTPSSNIVNRTGNLGLFGMQLSAGFTF